jgi:AcrR family transcriptional regulator
MGAGREIKNERPFFMPKLSRDAMEEKKGRIEAAAKRLFIEQGFHGTSMRHIAARAGVSLGNLYNYYRTKEELFESIIARHQQIIDQKLRSIFEDLDEPLRPDRLKEFARRVKALVNEHSDYWLLMYIDVLEFQNRHFRKMFDGLAKKMGRRFRRHFEELKRKRALSDGVDPAVGFTAAYMQFFNYFLVEKLFGGNRHFGIRDEEVISQLAGIFCRGILRRPGR